MAATARQDRRIFWSLMALAVAVRAATFDAYGALHPDEVIQYLEQAFRLLTGDGTVPWEYRQGMRSWVLPMFLAGPMALGIEIGGSAFDGVVAARIAAAGFCLIAVAAAWTIGRRTSRWHGVVAMAAVALWAESVVMSVHVLSESMASAAGLGAVALMAGDDRRRWIAAGALCALAGVLRFQYGPAIAVLMIGAAWGEWRRLWWLATGVAAVLIASAAVDVAMGHTPFGWLVTNVRLNLLEGKASQFGVSPAAFYVGTYKDLWGAAGLAVLCLAVLSGRRYRLLLLAAAVHVALHSAVGHKEYRFIALSTAIVIMLAGIGSVQVAESVMRRRGVSEQSLPRVAAVLIGLWGLLSLASGWSRPLEAEYRGLGEGYQLSQRAGADPAVCGIATMGSSDATIGARYVHTAAVYRGRRLPVFVYLNGDPQGRLNARQSPAGGGSFNAVLAAPRNEARMPGYRSVACGEDSLVCLYRRAGGCAPPVSGDPHLIANYLARDGF